MKINRQLVYEKYNGHCAYCGLEITLKQMQVDHIVPICRNTTDKQIEKYYAKSKIKFKRGTNDIDNLNSSCCRCNRWKSTMNLELFRSEIGKQIERLKRDSSAFRMALDYKVVVETGESVKFYFEKYCRVKKGT